MTALLRAQRIQAQVHTTAERDALPDVQAGRLIWNATENQLQVYDGAAWQSIFYSGVTINADQI